MGTSFSAARDYSRGSFSRGSRLAYSAVQGPLGPTPFEPGTVTPGAAMVKLSHAILAHQGQVRAQRLAEAWQSRQDRLQSLQLDKAEREAKPGYMTPHERESLDLERERLHQTKVPAAEPTVTLEPEDEAALGIRSPSPDHTYPKSFVQTKGALVREGRLALAHKDLQVQRAQKTAAQRRYTDVDSKLRSLDKDKERAVAAAEDAAQTQVNALIGRLQAGGHTGAIAKVLRVSGSGSLGQKPGQWIVDEAKRRAGVAHDQANAPMRARLEKIRDQERGILDQPDNAAVPEEPSDWESENSPTGGGGGGSPAP